MIQVMEIEPASNWQVWTPTPATISRYELLTALQGVVATPVTVSKSTSLQNVSEVGKCGLSRSCCEALESGLGWFPEIIGLTYRQWPRSDIWNEGRVQELCLSGQVLHLPIRKTNNYIYEPRFHDWQTLFSLITSSQSIRLGRFSWRSLQTLLSILWSGWMSLKWF